MYRTLQVYMEKDVFQNLKRGLSFTAMVSDGFHFFLLGSAVLLTKI